ncbi:hypothetical protein PMAYCL1PPCAC_22159, partial [Pristionchus mayeri]
LEGPLQSVNGRSTIRRQRKTSAEAALPIDTHHFSSEIVDDVDGESSNRPTTDARMGLFERIVDRLLSFVRNDVFIARSPSAQNLG